VFFLKKKHNKKDANTPLCHYFSIRMANYQLSIINYQLFFVPLQTE